jgi:repressor LexA
MQRPRPLTSRQQIVLAFVNETVRETGAPPTVREVLRHCGLKSPRGAQLQLNALAKCGYLVHETGVKRAYRPRIERPASSVPIVGRAPAGHPSEQPELHEGTLPLPWTVDAQAFAVRIVGDSMRDEHIVDGDLVVVDRKRQPRSGDVVLAAVRGEQTVKRFQKRGTSWVLEPANPHYKTIVPRTEGDQVVGCVVALVRHVTGQRPR